MLQVAIWNHDRTGETRCDLCGKHFEETYCSAALCTGIPQHDGRNAPANAIAFEICPACLEAGTRSAADRMTARAARLRRDATAQADKLDALADAIRNMPRENWLTRRELETHAAALRSANEAATGAGA